MGTQESPITKALHLTDLTNPQDALSVKELNGNEPRPIYCTKKSFDTSRVLDLFEIIAAGYQINIIDPIHHIVKEA